MPVHQVAWTKCQGSLCLLTYLQFVSRHFVLVTNHTHNTQETHYSKCLKNFNTYSMGEGAVALAMLQSSLERSCPGENMVFTRALAIESTAHQWVTKIQWSLTPHFCLLSQRWWDSLSQVQATCTIQYGNDPSYVNLPYTDSSNGTNVNNVIVLCT